MKRESWLPAAPASAPLARAIVREVADEQGLDGESTWDLVLATSEAVANAILHGGACEHRGLLVIEGDEDSISIEGCGCGSLDAPPRPAAPGETHRPGHPVIAAPGDHLP